MYIGDYYISLWEHENPLYSPPASYDEALYIINSSTLSSQVNIYSIFSSVTNDNKNVTNIINQTLSIPVPFDAVGSPGSDGELITWNPITNQEYGFWKFHGSNGSFIAEHGYSYNTTWNGVPPKGFNSRGAGATYMVGLLRKWEIEQGEINHALAMSTYPTSPTFVYPATKSDGHENGTVPMGTRFQIDPKYNETDFEQWGLNQTGIIIAKCLQKYGMFVIDTTGRNSGKIITEDNVTANWGDLINQYTVNPIPKNALRAVITPQP